MLVRNATAEFIPSELSRIVRAADSLGIYEMCIAARDVSIAG